MNATSYDASYPRLRQCLAPQFADADAEAIAQYMDERFGEGAADHYDAYLEGFFDDLGSAIKRAAPIVANVAGGVVQGATAGSAAGLPGIIAGGLAGGAGTALSSYGHGTLRDIGNALNTGTRIAGQFSPLGRVGGALGGTISGLSHGPITAGRLLQQGGQVLSQVLPGAGSVAGLGSLLGGSGGGAATQLTSLLGRPEVQQALMALNLGPAGRSTVPVGNAGTPVPTTAIAGLVQHLAAQAIDEAAAAQDGAESELSYMAAANGEFVGDPADDDDRAARVWQLLNQAQLERLAAAAWASRLRDDAPPRRRPPAPGDDWRMLLTAEMLEAVDAEDWSEDWPEDALVEDVAWSEAGAWDEEVGHGWR